MGQWSVIFSDLGASYRIYRACELLSELLDSGDDSFLTVEDNIYSIFETYLTHSMFTLYINPRSFNPGAHQARRRSVRLRESLKSIMGVFGLLYIYD